MNQETTKLLQELANKLGTTTEYLWRVLLKQAPIDATTTIFQIFIVAIFALILYKLHIRFSKQIEGDRYDSSQYDKNEGLGFVMIFLSIGVSAMIIVSIFSISDIVNGYFNPEYWALDKILSKAK